MKEDIIKVNAVVKAANWFSFTFEVKRRDSNAVHVYTFPNKKLKMKVGDKVIMEVKKHD